MAFLDQREMMSPRRVFQETGDFFISSKVTKVFEYQRIVAFDAHYCESEVLVALYDLDLVRILELLERA